MVKIDGVTGTKHDLRAHLRHALAQGDGTPHVALWGAAPSPGPTGVIM